MAHEFDIIVIGAGIAGASVAAHLAQTRKVLILEMEDRPGYHTTGRSAAAFEPNYGPAPIRALARASLPYFERAQVLTPRETIFYAPAGQQAAFDKLMNEQQGMREISIAESATKFPLLRDGYAVRAVLDPGSADIDVDLLHQSYLRQFKALGGVLSCSQPVAALESSSGKWTVRAAGQSYSTPIVVNAAGAWGGLVGRLAGASPIVLQPKRRSVAVVPAPPGHDVMAWPLIGDVAETWYCKPQSGKLLVSPADATPVEPHDAYGDDMALAEGIERFSHATEIEIARVEHSWGGLRSFSADGNPVVGYDGQAQDFFWLVGQGGYGIQTAPALSRIAAALVRGEEVPQDIADEGLELAHLLPERFANQ